MKRAVTPAPTGERLPLYAAVRLLRDDVIPNFVGDAPDADDEDRFLLWWVIDGHRSYPAAAQAGLPEDRRLWLFEPLGEDAAHPSGLGVNRLLHCLWGRRPDLQARFDLESAVGRWDAVGWFYTQALREFNLAQWLDQKTRDALLAPAWPPQGDAAATPSWLAVLLWAQQPVLQQNFDLEAAQGRAGLAAWFAQKGAALFPLALPAPAQATATGQPGNARPPASRTRRSTGPEGVNLIGLAFGELGIGEDVRMAAESCLAAGIPFKILDVHRGDGPRQADRSMAAHVVADVGELPYRINLFCLTGFETVRVYAEWGEALFAGRYNIGWWPWELPVWPSRWARAFDVIDEVWAATRFTETMFKAATRRPVVHMPMAVSVDRMRKVPRKALGLPSRRFLFLFIFDFNSYLARKNPMAVIDAFQLAFPADEGAKVGLVFKTMNSKAGHPAWQAFVERCSADERIVLIQQTLAREDVLGLIDACDAYVSLHRSEGMGRTLAEAMLLGKPVIATDFSGNTDFLTANAGYPVKWSRKTVDVGDYPFITASDAAYWADADVAHAAEQLKAAAEDPDQKANAPAETTSRFEFAKVGKAMAQRIKVTVPATAL